MSWFTDLAGKAESLLNNIDQSAAGAIQANETLSSLANASPTKVAEKEKETTKEAPINYRHSVAQVDYTKQLPIQTTTTDLKQAGINTAKPLGLRSKLESVKERPQKTSTPKDQDAALFDFLNSNETAATPRSVKTRTVKERIRKSTSSTSIASVSSQPEQQQQKTKPPVKEMMLTTAPPPAAFRISRSSSIDSMNSKATTNKTTNDNGSSSSEPNEPLSEIDVVSYPMDTASESEFELVSNTAASSGVASERDSGEETADGMDKGLISNLRRENRMLQNEITALHQEMKSMSDRNIRSKTDTEKKMRELQRKNEDLFQEFNVRSSQMEALRIAVTDLEKENETLEKTVKNLQTERERIIDDQTAGSGMHAQAIEQLRSRLEEAESTLIRERDLNRTLKEDSLHEREKRETENRKLAEGLRKSESERHAQKKRLDDALKEVNLLQTSLTANKHELSDYKQKASRILQSKERLIASLKGGSEADLTASATTSIELDELRQERDALKEDLMTARAELIQIRNEFQEIEGQYQQEITVLQEDIEELRKNLEEETGAKRAAEADASRYERDVRREREEATRVRSATSERLRDKEEEIGKLRNQLTMRSRSAPGETELESRLKQLTETLIQKQTLVETLATEKSSLVLQLERAEGQIQRLSQENSAQLQVAINDGGENAGLHNRNGNTAMLDFSNGPDSGVVGRVRKAASAVDRFSVRLGVFLRRYPIARLFVIVYMGLLHLWVMIVLLTYSPEVHGADFHARGDEHQAAHGLPNDG